MDPLEEHLRRSLADPRRRVLSSGDPVTRIAAGMRRRRRNRTALAGGGALAVVVAAVVVGSAVLQGSDRTGLQVTNPPSAAAPTTASASPSSLPGPSATPAPTRGTAAAAPPVTSSRATPGRSPSATRTPSVTPAPPAAPVPAGFTVADLSFVSATRGWALGTAPCANAPCTSLLRTNDGGRTWTGGPAPVAYLPTDAVDCRAVPCVQHLRFADALHGYAYGAHSVFVTSDGGRTWSRQADAPYIEQLEASGGDVLAVTPETDGCPPGCDYTISGQKVAGAAWVAAGLPPGGLHGDGTLLLRHGNDAYVLAYAHPTGGAGDAHAQVAVSHDRGVTWTTRPDPCSPVLADDPAERDAADASIGPDGSLAVLCIDRQGGTTGAVTVSSDGAGTFGAVRPLPTADAPHSIGTSGARLLVDAARGSLVELLSSADGGATWTSVATAVSGSATGPSSSAGGLLGFTDSRTGSWAPPGSRALWRSGDGGASWAALPFRR